MIPLDENKVRYTEMELQPFHESHPKRYCRSGLKDIQYALEKQDFYRILQLRHYFDRDLKTTH